MSRKQINKQCCWQAGNSVPGKGRGAPTPLGDVGDPSPGLERKAPQERTF